MINFFWIRIAKVLLVTASLITLSSCNIFSYTQLYPLIKPALFGVEDMEITEEYINEQKYSFLKMNIGRSGVAILVLNNINNNVFEWVSSEGERLFTYRGKIIRLFGSAYDLKVDSYQLFNQCKKESKVQYFSRFSNPYAFSQQYAQFEYDEQMNACFEEFQTEKFKFTGKNSYIYDKDGLPKTSIQKVHPRAPEIKLTFYFKRI